MIFSINIFRFTYSSNLVRVEGLEPPRITSLEFEASASTSSTIPAEYSRGCDCCPAFIVTLRNPSVHILAVLKHPHEVKRRLASILFIPSSNRQVQISLNSLYLEVRRKRCWICDPRYIRNRVPKQPHGHRPYSQYQSSMCDTFSMRLRSIIEFHKVNVGNS